MRFSLQSRDIIADSIETTTCAQHHVSIAFHLNLSLDAVNPLFCVGRKHFYPWLR